MTKDFCPLIKESCKGNCCKLYYEPLGDCSFSSSYIDGAKWQDENSKKKELREVHKEISEVLVNVYMEKITVEHGDIPNNERQLLLKLNEKRKAISASESLEKMWSK